MTQINCSDGGCIFGHPGGMATNGGCKCVPRPQLQFQEWIDIKRKIRTQTQNLKVRTEHNELLDKNNKKLRKLLFDALRIVEGLEDQQAMPDPKLDAKIKAWKEKVK